MSAICSFAFGRWQPIWTNTFAVDLKFIDSQSGAYFNRFYRARVP